MSDTATYLLWVNEDRTVLVRLWTDGNVEVCTRSDAYGLWGPPIRCLAEHVPA